LKYAGRYPHYMLLLHNSWKECRKTKFSVPSLNNPSDSYISITVLRTPELLWTLTNGTLAELSCLIGNK
jgi:hypothetical protein